MLRSSPPVPVFRAVPPAEQLYREVVALRREDLSSEQLEHQLALDRSWAVAQRGISDPELRAYLESSLVRLDAKDPAPLLTREEFLARTRVLEE